MARPLVPSWATDANFAAGAGVVPAIVGTPVRVEPASGVKAQGFVPGLGFDADTANWLTGLLADNVAWLQSLIDVDGSFNYETPIPRLKVYPFNHGWNPFADGDWNRYRGQSIASTVNEARWVVPLVGIGVGAEVTQILCRAKTNNGDAGRSIAAYMRVVRYSSAAVFDVSNPLTYESGPNPGWSPFLHGFSPPGPWFGNFPAIAGVETFLGFSQPFFIESGWEYALEVNSGVEIGAHNPDEFYGAVVTVMDHGARSGG